MALKFRKNNYYKAIIGVLICLILGFLYLGNYNLRESLETATTDDDTLTYQQNKADKFKKASEVLMRTGGNNNSDGSNAQIRAFTLAQTLEDKNTFLNE
jgi:predicted negative regulator of RcsB-dependent stress response